VEDVVKSFNIAKVVRGTISETTHFLDHDASRYEYPKRAGIFKYAFLVCVHWFPHNSVGPFCLWSMGGDRLAIIIVRDLVVWFGCVSHLVCALP
jgi:hypothetical protein